MFEVIFYRDRSGHSDIVEYLDELMRSGKTNKSDRINREKILTYINSLAEYGTRVGEPVVKHIGNEL